MFSRFARQAFRSSARSYSTAPHAAAKPSSDLPWIVGSAAVFGPTIFYLTSPPKVVSHAVHHPVAAAKEAAVAIEAKVHSVVEVVEDKFEEAKEAVEEVVEKVEVKAEAAKDTVEEAAAKALKD